MADALVDGQLQRLASRLDRLEQMGRSLHHATESNTKVQHRTDMEVQTQIQWLKEELAELTRYGHSTTERAHTVLRAYRLSAKKADLQRVSARVDQWAPQTRISAQQFQRMIDDQVGQ